MSLQPSPLNWMGKNWPPPDNLHKHWKHRHCSALSEALNITSIASCEAKSYLLFTILNFPLPLDIELWPKQSKFYGNIDKAYMVLLLVLQWRHIKKVGPLQCIVSLRLLVPSCQHRCTAPMQMQPEGRDVRTQFGRHTHADNKKWDWRLEDRISEKRFEIGG